MTISTASEHLTRWWDFTRPDGNRTQNRRLCGIILNPNITFLKNIYDTLHGNKVFQ
jgi:hypothetical protein